MKAIYLYGISGADQAYRVLKYQFITAEEFSIDNMLRTAAMMRLRCSSIERVFAIDNGYELYKDYRLAFKRNSIEGWAIFKDILERCGIEVK